MEELISCFTMTEELKLVAQKNLSFRPSAYAIMIHGGKLLVTVIRSTRKFMLPGGGVKIGETLEEALKRESKEECGIEIDIQRPLFFKENFFYYKPLDAAWHCFLFFFQCSPLTLQLTNEFNEKEDESEAPQWVALSSLRAEDFQVCGQEILESIRANSFS